MELADFVGQVPQFDRLSTREKIGLFTWFLHTHKDKGLVTNDNIRSCYRQLHLTPPDVSVYMPRMADAKPPELLKERGGYKLARTTRATLDAKYGVHQMVVQVSKLLSDLTGKVADEAERNFLGEVLSCYRVGAYRACVVMTWNLAFAHLLRWVMSDQQRLMDFNAAIPKRYPRKQPLAISSQEHFEELKEFEVIEVVQTAGITSKNIIEILREKLKRRNMAAHPSQVTVSQSQADDTVTDLVNNVVLALI